MNLLPIELKLEICLYLDIVDLEILCDIHNDFKKIYESNDFWIKKIKHDDFSMIKFKETPIDHYKLMKDLKRRVLRILLTNKIDRQYGALSLCVKLKDTMIMNELIDIEMDKISKNGTMTYEIRLSYINEKLYHITLNLYINNALSASSKEEIEYHDMIKLLVKVLYYKLTITDGCNLDYEVDEIDYDEYDNDYYEDISERIGIRKTLNYMENMGILKF